MSVYPRLRTQIGRVLDRLGESITLRQRTVTYNSNDDPQYTNVDTTIQASVVIAGVKEALESAGMIRVGYATIQIKYTIEANQSDLIKHQDIWYKIKSIAPTYPEGYAVVKELICSPLEKYPAQPNS